MQRPRFRHQHVLAAALVSAALAVPSSAAAHSTGDHAPVTANCPTPNATTTAVCEALQGAEYAMRHSGTQEAAAEFRENVYGGVTGYREVTGRTMGAFASDVEIAGADFVAAADAGLLAGYERTDAFGSTTFVAVGDFLDARTVLPCPLNEQQYPALPQTVGAMRVFVCTQWAGLMAAPGGTGILTDYLGKVAPLLHDVSEPFDEAVHDLHTVLEASTERTAADLNVATDALAAGVVRDAFYAAQCFRRGNYGPWTRPTGCPDPQ